MFRLIKIEASGTNQPEPHSFKKEIGTKISAGTALCLSGGIVSSPNAEDAPTLISYAGAEENAPEVLCYYVTPSMLFETTVNSSPSQLKVGDKVLMAEDSSGSCTLISTTKGGHTEIVDLMGAKQQGDRITVKFN